MTKPTANSPLMDEVFDSRSALNEAGLPRFMKNQKTKANKQEAQTRAQKIWKQDWLRKQLKAINDFERRSRKVKLMVK
jgi:hypothetical protein